MPDSHHILTNRQKSLVEWLATFGILIALTCLVQHMIVAIPGYITYPMIPAYLFAIASFALLAFQKPQSVLLIIISGILSLIILVTWIMHYSFSLVVFLLLIYHAIAIALLFMYDTPKALKKKSQVKKAEKDEWAGKI